MRHAVSSSAQVVSPVARPACGFRYLDKLLYVAPIVNGKVSISCRIAISSWCAAIKSESWRALAWYLALKNDGPPWDDDQTRDDTSAPNDNRKIIVPSLYRPA
jgi:hypothetical protein